MASGDLRVGTVVQVQKDEMVPADLLLLSTSHEKGQCFIDKVNVLYFPSLGQSFLRLRDDFQANLNGETKLEVLSSHTEIRPMASGDRIKKFSFSIGMPLEIN